MLAVIRPHSSKLAEFISSWMPFGSNLICFLTVGAARVLNPNVSVGCAPSWMRAKPSHLVLVLPGWLHQPLAAKLVPRAGLYAAWPTMIGSEPDSNTPAGLLVTGSMWCANAALSAPMRSAVVFGRSKASAGDALDTL